MPQFGGDDSLSTLHKISGCDDNARKADVVFIHGLGGDAFKTWSNDKNHENSWPYWLGKEFPNVGVWSVGYAASPISLPRFLGVLLRWWPDLGQSMPLADRGMQLLNKLQLNGIGEKPIIFIAHSLGGLVTKQILRSSRDTVGNSPDRVRLKEIARNTRGVMFLATPHWGANLASMLDSFREQVGTTVNIADLRAHDAQLANLFDWYRQHAPDIGVQTVTFFEGRDLGNAVRIVDDPSSHPGVGANPIKLDEDHSSIAKPAHKGEDVCLAANRLINDLVEPRPTRAQTEVLHREESLEKPVTKFEIDNVTSRKVEALERKLMILRALGASTSDKAVTQGKFAEILRDNRRLRDENERLKVLETEVVMLKTTVETVKQLLSKASEL